MIRVNFRSMVIMFAIAMLFFTVSTAFAQRGPDPEKAEKRLSILKDRLKLTDAQAEQIKVIMQDSQKQAEAERGKHKGDPEAAAKFREEHRQATETKIKGVLNDDQKKEYDKIKGDFRQNKQERRRDRDTDRQGSGGKRGPGQGPGQGDGARGHRGGR
jgi:hypothetical protein